MPNNAHPECQWYDQKTALFLQNREIFNQVTECYIYMYLYYISVNGVTYLWDELLAEECPIENRY